MIGMSVRTTATRLDLEEHFSKMLPPKYKTVLVCSSSSSSKAASKTEITSPKETEQNRYPIMEGRFSQELGPVPSSSSPAAASAES
jgi:hypothetical protein